MFSYKLTINRKGLIYNRILFLGKVDKTQQKGPEKEQKSDYRCFSEYNIKINDSKAYSYQKSDVFK